MNVTVIGAGAFGGWTALHLLRRGCKVTLAEAYGAGHSSSSSGGETRIIRCTYGDDALCTRFAQRSFEIWRESQGDWGMQLLWNTGMLFLAKGDDPYLAASAKVLTASNIGFELLDRQALARKFPQINLDGIEAGLFEPGAALLTARRNCARVLDQFISEGGKFVHRKVEDPSAEPGDAVVCACGPWLAKVFPDVCRDMIHPSRQEVAFLSTPAGSDAFSWSRFPCWFDMTSEALYYGLPDFEHRGFKLASDMRGEAFDPETSSRISSQAAVDAATHYAQTRFPALRNSVVTEARVCQYENSPNHQFVIGPHPNDSRIWIVGGGSGHGYKHGPAVGEYVADLLTGRATTVHSQFALPKTIARVRP